MKIIIPMSGSGKRFAEVGYSPIKPLIAVCGTPIIEHVVSMFPGNHDFTFICSKTHLESTDMRAVLNRIKPEAKIVPIDPHSKGPVYAISQIFNDIADDDEVMVSYCDYSMDWDFEKFQKDIIAGNYDAAVPSYIGFHPHLLRKYLYAGVLTDGNGTMTDIKEKHCFTENSMDCHQSAGAYYFRKGFELKKYFSELMEADLNLRGEYYASTPFELLLRDKLKVFVPEVDRFMQFGTPEDLEEFEAWGRHFAAIWKVDMPQTDIPEDRQALVAIPYSPESEEFKKSEQYWEPVFKRLLMLPA